MLVVHVTDWGLAHEIFQHQVVGIRKIPPQTAAVETCSQPWVVRNENQISICHPAAETKDPVSSSHGDRSRQNRIGSLGRTSNCQLPSGCCLGELAGDQEFGARFVLVFNTATTDHLIRQVGLPDLVVATQVGSASRMHHVE
jgi:hypothetical protein